MEDLESDIRDLIARRDIHAVICAYMRGQDRLQPHVQRAAFHDDARIDRDPVALDPDAYVEFAQGFLRKLKSSQHLIGQTDIRVENDVAYGEVYFIAFHRMVENGQEEDLFVAGRYIDQYEKRAGVWKIAKRREVIDWVRTDPAADGFLKKNVRLFLGSNGPDDFSNTRKWLS